MKNKINVIVISGGTSNERVVSLRGGEEVVSNMSKDKYNISQIEISSASQWLLKNRDGNLISKTNSKLPLIRDSKLPTSDIKKSFEKSDVIFLALHGSNGEDGRIQSLFDLLGLTYTGSGVLSSALGMDKYRSRLFVKKYGIRVPKTFSFYKNVSGEEIKNFIKESIGYPCVVKPNQSGSSIGVSIVKNNLELNDAIIEARRHDNLILVEEYINGKEVTCAVIGNSEQNNLIAFPLVEIIPDNDFFDFKSKYEGKNTQEICPARINDSLTRKVKNYALKIHTLLGCKGVTRCDFILKGNVFYFLEINTAPGLTRQSLCPKAALAYGWSFEKLIDEIINLALLK